MFKRVIRVDRESLGVYDSGSCRGVVATGSSHAGVPSAVLKLMRSQERNLHKPSVTPAPVVMAPFSVVKYISPAVAPHQCLSLLHQLLL